MANLTKRPSETKEVQGKAIIVKGKGERSAKTTKIGAVQKEFIIEQEVKGNSPDTIRYYNGVFKRLNKFVAIKELAKDFLKGKDLEVAGQLVPLAVLLDKDFEVEFKRLLEEENCNPRTINAYFRGYRAFAYYCMEERLDSIKKDKYKKLKSTNKAGIHRGRIKKVIEKTKNKRFYRVQELGYS